MHVVHAWFKIVMLCHSPSLIGIPLTIYYQKLWVFKVWVNLNYLFFFLSYQFHLVQHTLAVPFSYPNLSVKLRFLVSVLNQLSCSVGANLHSSYVLSHSNPIIRNMVKQKTSCGTQISGQTTGRTSQTLNSNISRYFLVSVSQILCIEYWVRQVARP